MKGILLSMIMLGSSVCCAAAQEPEVPDTVKIIENPGRVIVSRTADTTLIEVETENDYGNETFSYSITVEDSVDPDSDADLDFEIPFGIGKDKLHRKKRSRLQTSAFACGNIFIGQRFNYSDKGNVKNSIEWGVRDLIGIRWSRGDYCPSFSIGLGLGTRRYLAQQGFMYSCIGSNLVLVPVEEGCRVKSTELNVFNFQIPLLVTIPVGCDLKFIIGGIGCFNTYARAHTEIENGPTKIKTTYKGIQQRLFTSELLCSLGVCDILGVYVSWSPMTLFQSPYGPQLKSWSIGATLNL